MDEPFSKDHWRASIELALALATFGRARLSTSSSVPPGIRNRDVPASGIMGTGKIVGSLDGLTSAEKTVINDLVSQGKTVEVIPKTTASKTPDFLVNGVKTELKTLENPNINKGITRIQKGFKQGAETVIIDGRSAGLSTEQAQQIINRAKGTYSIKRCRARLKFGQTMVQLLSHKKG